MLEGARALRRSTLSGRYSLTYHRFDALVPVGAATRLRRSTVMKDVAATLGGPGAYPFLVVARIKSNSGCEDRAAPARSPPSPTWRNARAQEGPHGVGLVGRRVVGDHVNLTRLRLTGDDLTEEPDRRGAGVGATLCGRGPRRIACPTRRRARPCHGERPSRSA